MSDAVDRDALNELFTAIGGDAGWVQEVFEMFVTDTEERITAIEVAFDAGDVAEVGTIAHGIKGAAAYLGAARLRAIAASIETSARGGTLDPTPPHKHLREAMAATQQDWPAALAAATQG